VLGVWLPVLRWAVALLWIWTGIVSFALSPRGESLQLLARVGLQGAIANAALDLVAVLDLVLGLLTVATPSHRRGWVWAAQLLLVAGSTALVSIFLPEAWLDPYGPITRNLPLAAAIALLWSLERPRGAAA
jgi:hypothetical protein